MPKYTFAGNQPICWGFNAKICLSAETSWDAMNRADTVILSWRLAQFCAFSLCKLEMHLFALSCLP